MAGCLSSPIDPNKEHAAETRNAINPSMADLTMVNKVNEIDSLITNSQDELILQDFSFQMTTHMSKQYKFYNCQI